MFTRRSLIFDIGPLEQTVSLIYSPGGISDVCMSMLYNNNALYLVIIRIILLFNYFLFDD